jgi:alpha,alpha-trehalase
MTEPHKPIQTSGALFEAIQRLQIFADSKTFPDSVALGDPAEIERQFKQLLADFVSEHFEVPQSANLAVAAGHSMLTHIDQLWDGLTRPADVVDPRGSSRIPVPFPYVVPGGRFRESYYWDTYFTAEGMVVSGRVDLLVCMIRNFADLIERYGHIPNGNRSYYLSRSQPPFFCCMLQLLERAQSRVAIEPFIGYLEAEYRFWMDRGVESDQRLPVADRRTVVLPEGLLLNRYWDDANTPREESFHEDVALYQRTPVHLQADLYRNIRAAAESGWDFSSRWLTDDPVHGRSLATIRTTSLIPIDLNCLLFHIEQQLARWLEGSDPARAASYAAAAAARKAAIMQLCWDAAQGWFFDYCWTSANQADVWSLAGAYPLFFGLVSAEQAAAMAEQIEQRFVRPGGVVTTDLATGQQWDAPNGWAPLQWIVVGGLQRYGYSALAREIATRFVRVAADVYAQTGKMMEKYDVCDPGKPGGGGEYPNQDGFGWTNGVVRALIDMFGLEVGR